MRRSKWLGILAAATFAFAGKAVVAADTLTILWAEWDPANYLQELVKDYEKQSGVKVKVETVPWPNFQTKAFTEFNANGAARFSRADDVRKDLPYSTSKDLFARAVKRSHRGFVRVKETAISVEETMEIGHAAEDRLDPRLGLLECLFSPLAFRNLLS